MLLGGGHSAVAALAQLSDPSSHKVARLGSPRPAAREVAPQNGARKWAEILENGRHAAVSPPAGVTPAAPGTPHWLRGACGWLAFVVPLFVALTGLAPASQWRNDVAIVRTLGFVPIGAEGVISAVLAQCAALLPLGGRVLRAALPAALATGCAAGLIYGFALRLLDKNAPAPRLTPVLALLAACPATIEAASSSVRSSRNSLIGRRPVAVR